VAALDMVPGARCALVRIGEVLCRRSDRFSPTFLLLGQRQVRIEAEQDAVDIGGAVLLYVALMVSGRVLLGSLREFRLQFRG